MSIRKREFSDRDQAKKFGPWTSPDPWFGEYEEKRVRMLGRPDREVEAVMREAHTGAKRKQSHAARPVGT